MLKIKVVMKKRRRKKYPMTSPSATRRNMNLKVMRNRENVKAKLKRRVNVKNLLKRRRSRLINDKFLHYKFMA